MRIAHTQVSAAALNLYPYNTTWNVFEWDKQS